MVKAVIFDCFGVIITDALERAVAEVRSKDPDAARRMADLIAASNHGLIDVVEVRAEIAGIMGLSLEQYVAQVVKGAAKDAVLLEFIARLRAQGYKTAMLSNVGKGSLWQRFTHEELERCFDAVVASGDIGYAKPEPQAYESVADKLGVRLDECVFTDDREEYCQGARAVGMQAVRYESFERFKLDLFNLLAVE